MKTIAVIVHSFTNEYSLQILSGINKFFQDKNVRIVMSQVTTPHFKRGIYEYQCWTAAELLSSKEIDAVIIVSGSLTSEIPVDELINYLHFSKDIPIISIAADLKLPNSYYVIAECKSAYKKIVTHFKEKHGKKKFAFMSANITGSQEALERYEAYKDALKCENLPFDENLVMDAKFTRTSGYKVFTEKYKSKEDIDFDAILAANDLMAQACLIALEELGVKVPEEVAVAGFDDSRNAEESNPKLTSVDQNIFEQGVKGAELVWNKLNGVDIPHETFVSSSPVYRHSCGCIPLDNKERIFIDDEGQIQDKVQQIKNRTLVSVDYFSSLSEIDQAYNMFDQLDPENTLNSLFYVIPYLMEGIKLENLGVYFYDEPVKLKREDNFTVPGSARVCMQIYKNKNIKVFEPRTVFNPAEKLMLQENFPDEPGVYVLTPLFSGIKNYGYMTCKITSHAYSIGSLHLKILSNAICKAYEHSKALLENEELLHLNEELTQNNSDLNKKSNTDELTKILNRRGFLEIGQRSIDIAADMNTTGLLFFIDMDNLKKINDTYGHKMGDSAIASMAYVLSHSFRANDIVGRLGGDEFAAIAVGMTISQEDIIRKKVISNCEKEMKDKKYPFDLSCSIGAVEFNANHKAIMKLLSLADEKLYIEKRRKHQNDGR